MTESETGLKTKKNFKTIDSISSLKKKPRDVFKTLFTKKIQKRNLNTKTLNLHLKKNKCNVNIFLVTLIPSSPKNTAPILAQIPRPGEDIFAVI